MIAAKGDWKHRIQVKACIRKVPAGSRTNKRVYQFTASHGKSKKRSYLKSELDYMVLVCVPEDDFFVLPADVACSVTSIKIAIGGKYWGYRGRWDLLEND